MEGSLRRKFIPIDLIVFQAYVPERQNDYATYNTRGKRPFCNAFEGRIFNVELVLSLKSIIEH